MLQKITIQNFRSLKNVSLNLQDVNVLIGANNSGKTNFLKALEFLITYQFNDIKTNIDSHSKYLAYTFQKKGNKIGYKFNFLDGEQENNLDLSFNFNEKVQKIVLNLQLFEDLILTSFRNFTLNSKIYQPNSSKLIIFYPLNIDKMVNADASNLVAFLDNMRDEFPEVYQKIIQDLHTCLEEFTDLRFQKVEPSLDSEERKLFGNQTFKKLGLADKFGNTYWAEELSEGTLYFLALLAIIHQPNPPKLLLLEEPERGIHPRRIKEVMDFIFRLASEKQIQVILTTHSPIVLDCFRDYPEKVFVFDKNEEGATEIKNLETDILIPLEEKEIANGLEPSDYTRSMGTNWEAGFFGGVPKNSKVPAK